MTTQETKQGKIIGNLGVLDLRSATEASVAEIKRIGNVGAVFYSPETAPLITRLNIGNVGATQEIPANARVVSGQEVFSRDTFKNRTEALTIVVSGQLIVEPDVPEDDIERGLEKLIISGQVYCPEHLAGVVQAKIRDLSGQIYTYHKSAKVIMGNLSLTESYLQALDDGSELVLFRNLNASQVLPNDLLAQKIQKIQVYGRVVCCEENVKTLLARQDDKTGSAKLTIVPAGFEWIDKPLTLDSGLLAALAGGKLYCTQLVRIERDVDSSTLEKALEKLVVKDTIICPATLRSTLAQKCNLLETQAIFYENELWLVENEMSLIASRFDYLEGQATLVVWGELSVSAEIEPKMLAERLDKVHNFGEIMCTPDQMAALQSRLGINQGEFIIPQADSDDDQNKIGNIGYLKL